MKTEYQILPYSSDFLCVLVMNELLMSFRKLLYFRVSLYCFNTITSLYFNLCFALRA